MFSFLFLRPSLCEVEKWLLNKTRKACSFIFYRFDYCSWISHELCNSLISLDSFIKLTIKMNFSTNDRKIFSIMVISSIFITINLHLINDYHCSWKIIHNRLSHIYSKKFEFRTKCLKLLFLCPRCSFVLFFIDF